MDITVTCAAVLSQTPLDLEAFLDLTYPQLAMLTDGLVRLGKGDTKKEATLEDFVRAFGGK